MGFYFNNFQDDKQQYINLSKSARLVIEEDMNNFYMDAEKISKAGFYNILISNFYEQADASIGIRLSNLDQEIKAHITKLKLADSDLESINKLVKSFREEYKKKLILKSSSYEKGASEKFRINNKNCELLKDDLEESDYYHDNLGLYLKALFEEYALLPNYVREQVIFKDIMQDIRFALQNKRTLKLTLKKQYSKYGEVYYTKKFFIKPYKIVEDDQKNFNYLIGLSKEIKGKDSYGEERLSSIRISRIDHMMILKTLPYYIPDAKKKEIDTALVTKLPQFIIGDLIDLKVRFTEKGLESFKRQLYMRPHYFEVDKDDKYIYTFKCTIKQTFNYFIKFLDNVEILEPIYIREKFTKAYKYALEHYQNEGDNDENL